MEVKECSVMNLDTVKSLGLYRFYCVKCLSEAGFVELRRGNWERFWYGSQKGLRKMKSCFIFPILKLNY